MTPSAIYTCSSCLIQFRNKPNPSQLRDGKHIGQESVHLWMLYWLGGMLSGYKNQVVLMQEL